jgi:hypothetical protein
VGSWTRGGDDGNSRRTRTQQPSVYPQAWQGNPNDPRLQHYRDLERRNQNGGYDRRGDATGVATVTAQLAQRPARRRRQLAGRRPGDRRTDWNRGWRNDNRYNWSYLARPQPARLPPVALLFALPELELPALLDRPVPRLAVLQPALLDRRSLAVSSAACALRDAVGALL